MNNRNEQYPRDPRYTYPAYNPNGAPLPESSREPAGDGSPLAYSAVFRILSFLVLIAAVMASLFLLTSFSYENEVADQPHNVTGIFEQRMDTVVSTTLNGVTSYDRSYYIPDDVVVCEKPNQELFGESADDAVIQSVISGSDLARYADLYWKPGLEYYNGVVPKYYSDPSIFTLAWKVNDGYHIYNYCEVLIADGSQFRRFLCNNKFGSNNQKVATTMAESVNAVVAMNGDFYGNREPGVIVYQRKLYRNNPLYLDICYVNDEGDFLFTHGSELGNSDSVRKFIDDNNIMFSLSFGPVLVEHGKPLTYVNPKKYKLGEVDGIYARAAIGTLGKRHYLYCTIEGANGGYYGTDVVTMAKAMYEAGCDQAYTLDGGQTAELIINNQIYNYIIFEAERTTTDIIYFATAVSD